MTLSPGQKWYILLATDYYTKGVEAQGVYVNKRQGKATDLSYPERTLITNNDTQLDCKEFKGLCDLLLHMLRQKGFILWILS